MGNLNVYLNHNKNTSYEQRNIYYLKFFIVRCLHNGGKDVWKSRDGKTVEKPLK